MRPNRLFRAWVNLQGVHNALDRDYMSRSEALDVLRAISGFDVGEDPEEWERALNEAYGDIWRKEHPLPRNWADLREAAKARLE